MASSVRASFLRLLDPLSLSEVFINRSMSTQPRPTPIVILFGPAGDPLSHDTAQSVMTNSSRDSGEGRYIADVVVPDLLSSNGVLHIIDKLLILPMNITQVLFKANKYTTHTPHTHRTTPLPIAFPPPLHPPAHALIAVRFCCCTSPRCRTSFLQALNDSGMLDEIESMDNITVLAPTNHAWQDVVQRFHLNSSTSSSASQADTAFSDVGNQSVDTLRSIVRTLITDGAYYPTELCQGANLPLKYDPTCNVSVTGSGDTLAFNGSRAIKKGILLRNGHCITHPPSPSAVRCSLRAAADQWLLWRWR